MFISYFIILSDLLPSMLKYIFVIGATIYFYKCHNKLLFIWLSIVIIYFISLFLIQQPIHNGIVITKYNDSYIVSNALSSWRVYESYSGQIGDLVSIQGEFIINQLNPLYRSIGYIKNPQINILSSTLNPFTYYIDNYPLIMSFFFHTYDEDFGILSALAIQVDGALEIVTLILRRCNISKFRKIIIMCFNIVITFLFPNFTSIRLLLKSIINTPDMYIVSLIIMFPHISSHPIFFILFLPTLIKNFHVSFNEHNSSFRSLLFIFFYHRYHILENVAFRYIRKIGGLIYLLSFVPFLYPLLESLLAFWQSIIKTEWWFRFEIYGTIPIVLIFVFMYHVIKQEKRIFYILSLYALFNTYNPWASVHYINVGQGDATIISYPFNMYTILIDTGKKEAYYLLEKELKRLGVHSIDTLLITHDDTDHSDNVQDIMQDYFVKDIITSKKESIRYLDTYLWDIEYDDDNENSLITGVRFNSHSFLFMGDATIEQEKDLLKRYPSLKVDILKLGHHGSKTSTHQEFLLSLETKIGIVSSNPKIYGHPHGEVLKNLALAQSSVLQTSQHGTISFVLMPFITLIKTSTGKFVIMR